MVESKSVVLQMIPHTLFIEWDFWNYSRNCSLDVYCSQHCSLAVATVHDTIHWQL